MSEHGVLLLSRPQFDWPSLKKASQTALGLDITMPLDTAGQSLKFIDAQISVLDYIFNKEEKYTTSLDCLNPNVAKHLFVSVVIGMPDYLLPSLTNELQVVTTVLDMGHNKVLALCTGSIIDWHLSLIRALSNKSLDSGFVAICIQIKNALESQRIRFPF